MFLKVAETQSFAATARLSGCSQPAVSQAIARLEDVYGGDLFERHPGSKLTLTPIGEAILPSARTLLHTVDQQMQRASEAARGRIGVVTLGFHAGLAGGRLREAVTEFIAAHPHARVQMVEASPKGLEQRLLNREVDLIVAVASAGSHASSVSTVRLWNEPLFAALPPNDPLAARMELDWSDVMSSELIVSASSGELSAFRLLASRSTSQALRIDQCAVSRDALLEMVGIGVGRSIILGAPPSARRDVEFRLIGDIGAGIPIEAVWRRQDRNPLRHRLLQHIRGRQKPPTP